MLEAINRKDFTSYREKESRLLVNLLKRQNEMLGQSLLNLDRLLYLHKAISLMDIKEIKKVLTEKLPSILSIRHFSIFLYKKSKRELSLFSHNRKDFKDDLTFHVNDSEIMRDAITQGRYILEQDFSRSKYFVGKSNSLFKDNFFVCVPLMVADEIIGVMNLTDNDSGIFSVSDLDYVLNVSEFISLSISNALLYEKTQILSITDGLTGLYDHQEMLKVLDNEWTRSSRYNSPLSIAIIDLDNFKSVNDTYGHQMGDKVLMNLAAVVKSICRTTDTASRYGGEEFLLILAETGVDGAMQIAERIRKEFASLKFEKDGLEFNVTLSCGIAGIDGDKISSPSTLIQVADQALYHAKKGGRNRTYRGEFNETTSGA
jgi:diguanylate cyclase (GGDEF)-like protein